MALAPWTSMKSIPGNRGLSFTRRQASSTGATHDCPVAGYSAAGDIGFQSWGISPAPRAVGGAPALPTGAPPTLNYLPGVPAPTAALEFVKTISGTRCLSLCGRHLERVRGSWRWTRAVVPTLSSGRVHRLGGLAGAKPRLAVDVCDRRRRLWRSFPWRGFGNGRPAGSFLSSEPLMLPPGLAGVHSREFPGKCWKYESLSGFPTNRLSVEADVDSRVVHVMDPAG